MVTITRNKEEATLLYLKQIYVFPDHYFFFGFKEFYLFPVSLFFSRLTVNVIIGKAVVNCDVEN